MSRRGRDHPSAAWRTHRRSWRTPGKTVQAVPLDPHTHTHSSHTHTVWFVLDELFLSLADDDEEEVEGEDERGC